MGFRDALTDGCFCLGLKSDSKEGIIEEMVDMLAEAGKIKDRDDVLRAVLEREDKMSTGMQHGVALPHGKTLSVDKLVTALGIKREGVDFASLDGKPSHIFVLTISSILRTGPHIEYLSEISKVLNSAGLRERLLQAESVDELLAILTA